MKAPRLPRNVKTGGATSLTALGTMLAKVMLSDSRLATKTTPRSDEHAWKQVLATNTTAKRTPPSAYILSAKGVIRKMIAPPTVAKSTPVCMVLTRELRFLLVGRTRGSE